LNEAQLAGLGVAGLADAIRAGEVTAEAVAGASLARLRRLGPVFNALVADAGDGVLEEARKVDTARNRGGRLGPLAGVPLAHKDLFYRAGRESACGSSIRAGFMPDHTATVLARLDLAGALDLGRLHMCEFAMSPTGFNGHYGHGRNPWNADHCCGGSSSGSGIAVAARLVAGSLGTDTGGSIRHPAAMCGITGLKPTLGRVSRHGVMPLSWSLDCVGPLAASARDCARLMQVIAGADGADAHTQVVPVPDYEAALNGSLAGRRIAVPRGYYVELVDPAVRRALDEALAVMRAAGATIIDTGSGNESPDMAAINAMAHVALAVEAATLHRRWLRERPQDYADQVRTRIEPGLFYPAVRYAEALALRARLTAEWLATAMGDADLVFLPAVSIPVPSIAQTTSGSPADVAAAIAACTHCTRGINYLGLPAVSVPCGFTPDGLPVGFQLVGRGFEEASLLAAADAYQRLTDWHTRVPPAAA
jgi:aspartyl-tRNA(Asn)/glutamyl-tRNA(Gln) amidotransferase subunit A